MAESADEAALTFDPMKRLLLTTCLSFVALMAGAKEITLIEDGRSDYVIACAEKVDQPRVTKAAAALQFYLREATGVELPIVAESEVPVGTPAIYLGWSEAARRAGIVVEKVADWSYHNRVVGRNIILVGEDRETKIAEGPKPRATGVYGSFKAVTAFLENQVGVRFLMPGRFGTHIPKTDRLVVDAALDERWSPIFRYLGGRMASYAIRAGDDVEAMAFGFANHMFGESEFLYDYGGHSYIHAVPEKEFWPGHPEYFAEADGIRSPKNNHLCISNPEVQDLMLAEMERQLDRGFQWVELEQTDGYVPCECETCRALHPDPGERVWKVHRHLAERLEKSRPGKTVMMTSYQPTRLPPKSFDSFPGNVAIRMTRYRPEDFAMWERWGAKEIPKSLYATEWLTAHPQVSPWVAVNMVRLFEENRIQGMYLCGGIIENSAGNWYPWGLGGPGFYAFFRALHDPQVDPVALRAEYVNAAFGEAAPAMQNFFAALDERMDHFWWLYRADPENSPASTLTDRRGGFCRFFYPPEMLEELDRSLERAVAAAGDDEAVRARLRLISLEYDYLKSHALVYHFYRSYRLAPSETTLAMLEEKVRDFLTTRDRIWPGGKPTKIEGLPGPFAGSDYKVHRQIGKGAPFNWDFDLLREKGVLPGVGTKRTEALPVEGITLDGKLDDADWEKLPFQNIGEIAMGRGLSETQFKIGYDADGLTIAFRARVATPGELDGIEPVGRDGTAWRQENLELVIDPIGTRRLYYHFMINPAPDSTFDRRFGYHEAPDHPLYQDFELNWNGDWDYAVHIDKEQKIWTAELHLPFATLEVEPPKSGATWTMNIGRNQFPEGAETSRDAVVYLWSPNIQSRTFHDMSVFGELVFR